MRTHSILLIILAIIIIVVYIRFYLASNDQFEILQMGLDKLRDEHLLEKSPIVITDRIVDPISLLKTAFAYSYTFKKFNNTFTFVENSKSQNTILIAIENAIVNIEHPKKNNYDTLEIPLKTNQVLVVPYAWSCKVLEGKVNAVELDSVITYLMKFLPI